MRHLRLIATLAVAAAAGTGVGIGVASAAGDPVWVVSQQGAELARVEAGTVAGRIPLGPAPVAAAADRAGRLYLTHPDGRAVTVVAPGEPPRRLPVPGQAFGLAVSPDGARLYVGDWSGDRVLRICAATGAVEGAAAVGRDPAHLVLDRRGRLYVADRESRQVSVIDTGTMARVAVVPTGEAPFALALAPDEASLYVANVRSGDLTVIDTATLRARATVPAGRMPYGVAVTGDGSRILVTNQHAAAVTVIDAARLEIVATVAVGPYPEGIAVAGPRAYVANWFSDDVSVINLATWRETARIKVAEGPRAVLAVGEPAR
ncbi:YVTN family beta-propeller protein [Methylobacterium sp. PvP062]|jgi:YVTN family beta-propeller protein|uniref:YVTN family beta-propeller protein n=1 Tax=Methylobacterium radiotolerans TaxID=31998 RepID=A0ABV2NHH7_9HYPH|nr:MULTISPECIES: YncE family protein [unclassified Methylobacterium]MBP2497308.1 YVTN family beta-propeller protein [Methylobacterium sp. PvP105]MBP2502821.1 YVTN family beta-propeller protein [Methylobacterium sp. PvP109]MCX7333576.1 YncE family protein [Hyphomicrobiales bacterium]